MCIFCGLITTVITVSYIEVIGICPLNTKALKLNIQMQWMNNWVYAILHLASNWFETESLLKSTLEFAVEESSAPWT